MRDRINHPDHYTHGGLECIQAIEAALGPQGAMDYCRGNAMKYLWRCMYKKNTLKDLQKAEWYIQRAQQYVGNLPTSTVTENSVRWEAAKKDGRTHWVDTSNRVRAIANGPEGQE